MSIIIITINANLDYTQEDIAKTGSCQEADKKRRGKREGGRSILLRGSNGCVVRSRGWKLRPLFGANGFCLLLVDRFTPPHAFFPQRRGGTASLLKPRRFQRRKPWRRSSPHSTAVAFWGQAVFSPPLVGRRRVLVVLNVLMVLGLVVAVLFVLSDGAGWPFGGRGAEDLEDRHRPGGQRGQGGRPVNFYHMSHFQT